MEDESSILFYPSCAKEDYYKSIYMYDFPAT